MTRNDFIDLSRNNPRDADIALFDLVQAFIDLQTQRNAEILAMLNGLADIVAALDTSEPAPESDPA
jgi:hypothetical protein